MSAPHSWPEFFTSLNRATAMAEDARLRRARTLIDRRFAEPLNIEDMARAAAFSHFHFARQFRRAFGVTPHQYLTERRIRHARMLLEQTDMPVTQVCLAVGFHSLGSFSSLFRRHVGRSPSDYRRRWIQSPGMPRIAVPACFLWKYSKIEEVAHARRR